MARASVRPIRVSRVGSGYAAEGRGFYVWDEDPQVVMESARDLERRLRELGVHPRRSRPGQHSGLE